LWFYISFFSISIFQVFIFIIFIISNLIRRKREIEKWGGGSWGLIGREKRRKTERQKERKKDR
jgi:hypothetical protein